jgi:hypothetical protein
MKHDSKFIVLTVLTRVRLATLPSTTEATLPSLIEAKIVDHDRTYTPYKYMIMLLQR